MQPGVAQEGLVKAEIVSSSAGGLGTAFQGWVIQEQDGDMRI